MILKSVFLGVLTLYNKYYDPKSGMDKYQRTIVRGIHMEENRAVNVVKNGLVSADAVLSIIPFEASFSGRSFLLPWVFDSMTDKEKHFTIRAGDRIIKGECYTEIERSFDREMSGVEAYTVTGVDTCDYGFLEMRHWEVSAK